MKTIVIMFVVLLCGCAAQGPIVDMKDVDPIKYDQDLRECQQYAQQGAGPGTGLVAGTLIGYGLGYLAARASGYDDPAEVGRGFAVVGAATGAGSGAQNEYAIVYRCMQGRGYHVLG